MILRKQQVRVSLWEMFISSWLISLRLWLFPAPSCWLSVLRGIRNSWPGIHFSFLWGSWEGQWTSQLKNLAAQQYFITIRPCHLLVKMNAFKNKTWAHGMQLWLPRYISTTCVNNSRECVTCCWSRDQRHIFLLRAFYCWARSSYILVFNRFIQINITGEFEEVHAFF